MFTSASYELKKRNITHYYKVIYMFTSASYELKKNGTNYYKVIYISKSTSYGKVIYMFTSTYNYRYSQICLKDYMYYAKTCLKRPSFSISCVVNSIQILPVLRGHLCLKTLFQLSIEWSIRYNIM